MTTTKISPARESSDDEFSFTDDKKENKTRLAHTCDVNDKVLVKQAQSTKCGTDPCEGPHTIKQVNKDNGTVRLQLGKVIDTFNIRNAHPYELQSIVSHD